MKKQDLLFFLFLILLFSPFFIFTEVFTFYENFNLQHGIIVSFIKFAILATLGEMIGLRLRTGKYNRTGFGIIPRALIWGFIGITIKMAFIIFSLGVPVFIEYCGLQGSVAAIKQADITPFKVFTAFSISLVMNIVYAPIMMTFHKITDTHIEQNKGSVKALVRPIKMKEIFININWAVQWGFVFKKTIPLFWIPAHTITFLLPEQFQVLFAALLSIALGIILAIASNMSKKNA